MAERVTPRKMMSLEEYLTLEETATVKHEYVAGTIHAMVGATKRHNRIALNVATRLVEAARGGSGRVYACGPEGDDPLVEDAPCLIVEVTSPSTEAIDRREKLLNYRKIPSLRAYLIVDQNRRWIERYWLDEAGEWQRGGLDEGAIPVPCPETNLPSDEVYRGL